MEIEKTEDWDRVCEASNQAAIAFGRMAVEVDKLAKTFNKFKDAEFEGSKHGPLRKM